MTTTSKPVKDVESITEAYLKTPKFALTAARGLGQKVTKKLPKKDRIKIKRIERKMEKLRKNKKLHDETWKELAEHEGKEWEYIDKLIPKKRTDRD